jgi:hypothetical protein
MAGGNAKLITVAAVLASMAAAVAWADEPARRARVVLHVKDYQTVPPGELREAQAVVQRVYARIGVDLVWTTGSARIAPDDGDRHIDVVIMNKEMTDRDAPDAKAFGKGNMRIHRATVYFPRIVAHAHKTHSNPCRVLALVLAHEIGHTLLPEYSHSSSGWMRASWEGAIVQIPNFAREQGDAIRAMLAVSH